MKREGLEKKMVGAARFELATSCTRNKRASQATLRPDSVEKLPFTHPLGNPNLRSNLRSRRFWVTDCRDRLRGGLGEDGEAFFQSFGRNGQWRRDLHRLTPRTNG